MKRLGFNRAHRVLARADFLRCYGGRRLQAPNFIIFVLPTGDGPWRLGLAVSRKVGGAVRRNRVKRLLREFFRRNQSSIPPGTDLVAVPKKHLDPTELTYADVERELVPVLTGMAKARQSKSGAVKN